MYVLSISELRKVAATAGDITAYAISRRAGIAESSAYRILNGQSQPDLNSAMRLAVAYGVEVSTLMVRETEAAI
ncbi:helix-turn-helix domain-containing protein [Streptomyces sp. GTA36]